MAKRARRQKLDIPLPDTGIGSLESWSEEVADAERVTEKRTAAWRDDLELYEGGKPRIRGLEPDEVFPVNVPFYTLEQKKPNLFFTTPNVQVEALQAETEDSAPLVQQIINDILGRGGVNALATMDEVTSDCGLFGLSATKIGYEAVRVPVKLPKMVPGPNGAPVHAVDAAGKPLFDDAAKVVFEQYYFRRFSVADLRAPRGFASGRYDLAPWLGWSFPLSELVLEDYGIDKKDMPTLKRELSLLSDDDRSAVESVPRAVEIWYRAHVYDEKENNPDRIRQLIFVPGSGSQNSNKRGVVLVHRNCAWQKFDEHGALVQGIKRLPIKVFATRITPETSAPKSDVRILRSVTEEKTASRSQMVQQRRHNIPLVAANKNAIDKDILKQIEQGKPQTIILTDGDARNLLHAVERSAFPVENFDFDRITQQDIDRLSAAGSNQQSLTNQSSDTATEASLIQQSYDTRLAKERERVLETFLTVAEDLFALMQMFCDREQATRIVGETGMKQLVTWNKDQIQGRFGFSLKPDSAVRTNASEERELFLRYFNLVFNAQETNRLELLRRAALRFNEDPAKMTAEPPPPPPPDNPHKLTLSVSVDPAVDLNPASPHYPNVIALLQAAGWTPPPTGGVDGPVKSPTGPELVNKHEADLSGQMPGPGPM